MKEIIEWLLKGDVSIQYLTHRDLLCSDLSIQKQLQNRIQTEGFGARYLSMKRPNGHWGVFYYQHKWTSTHYTLLDLKNLGIPESCASCVEMVKRMFGECQLDDGGLNLAKSKLPSDVCVDGMILNYSSYFCNGESFLDKLVHFLLSQQKPDGGFSWDNKSLVGDPHTTICVLEGFEQYLRSKGRKSLMKIDQAKQRAREYLLGNDLFIFSSDKRYRKLTFPFRYRYDLLRALFYFAKQNDLKESRLIPAINWLIEKRQNDKLWVLENEHPGNVHFQMEEIGSPSRFITLMALYILKTGNWI
ncbi:MAG: hypothetical protein WC466_07550 [Candidatus Izemoplasmatales bacterium]